MDARTPDEWVEVPFEVQAPHDGLRVDAFLARRLHRYSRAEVQRLISAGKVYLLYRDTGRIKPPGASGRVSLSGRPTKPSARVHPGDRVVIRYPRREEPPVRHAALTVLYEDGHLLAVDKPGDVLSHPTDKVVANSVTSILRSQFPRARLHLTHRLDRETSGVILLAKSPAVARALTDDFTARRIQKEYLALVAGRVAFDCRIVDLPIGPEGAAIKVRQTTASRGGPASEARTEFKRLASAPSASLIQALPKTGRLHQIRVHLAWLGHPVLGDKLYTGAGETYMKAVRRELTPEDLLALGAPRQMLHARRLRLRHPETGGRLEIEAPAPADFLDCMAGRSLRFPPDFSATGAVRI